MVRAFSKVGRADGGCVGLEQRLDKTPAAVAVLGLRRYELVGAAESCEGVGCDARTHIVRGEVDAADFAHLGLVCERMKDP